MNKDERLYIQLTMNLDDMIHKSINDNSKSIYMKQSEDLQAILNEIGIVILDYNIEEDVLKLNKNEKKRIKNHINNKLKIMVKEQYLLEASEMNRILIDVAKDKYYTNAYLNELIPVLRPNFKLKKITEKQLKQIINTTIKGENWNSRLLGNKKQLEDHLRKEMYRFLDGQTNLNAIKKNISSRFNINAYNSKRLIINEATKCQYEANEVFAKEHRVTEQMFMATFDNKTSEICQSLDSQIFNIDDPEKPVLPIHVNCRSVLVNMPYEGWKPNTRKDNITKEYVNYESYNEWKEANI